MPSPSESLNGSFGDASSLSNTPSKSQSSVSTGVTFSNGGPGHPGASLQYVILERLPNAIFVLPNPPPTAGLYPIKYVDLAFSSLKPNAEALTSLTLSPNQI